MIRDSEKIFLEKNLQRLRGDLDELQRYVDELNIFLPLPFCIVNPLNLVLSVNQSFQDSFGYEEMEVIGNKISTLFKEKKKITGLQKSLITEDKKQVLEMTFLTKEKEEMPVSVSAMTRRDDRGNYLGYFLTITDITESKKFQEELEKKVKEQTKRIEEQTQDVIASRSALLNLLEDNKEDQEKLIEEQNKTMAIITNFTDGLLFFNKENILSLVNPRAEKLFEIDHNNVSGKTFNELKKRKSMADLMNIIITEMKNNKELKIEDRKEMQLEDGTYLEISIVPVKTSARKEDTRIGTLIVIHDITREKNIEAMKSEFVSIAAHQLRTPLSAIKWTMTMLLDGDLGELNEGQKELVDKTYLSNERMVYLINDLLNVTRIEEGKYLYKPSLAQIEDIIDQLVENHSPILKKKKINLKIEKSKVKIPTTAVDLEKITLAIENLLDNAIKYTPEGGNIFITLEKKEKDIFISIQDTGVGIPKDQQPRLFSKFFRAANVVRMETEGSGLGLFICKNIIEAHGGTIGFTSEEGKGSTFYFNLPIKTIREFEDFTKKL